MPPAAKIKSTGLLAPILVSPDISQEDQKGVHTMRTSGGADEMDNVVKFPAAPEWARTVDAKLLDRLIAKGYLRHRQRRDWRAVEMALNSAFYAAVFESRPELSPQEVIEHVLRHSQKTPRKP
jgi:hypothetical protein